MDYYLALEKAFRASFAAFVKRLHGGKVSEDDLFAVVTKGELSKHQVASFQSFSVWGFYGSLALLVVLTRYLVL